MRAAPLLAPVATLALALPASAQMLMVPESSGDQVMLFDASDGSLIDATFIDLTSSTGTSPATPIEAIDPGNGEIWISDQVADVIFRFSADGTTYLGEFASGRDNMRGIGIAQGSLWVSNSGNGGSGFGDVLKEYDLAGAFLAAHTGVGNPFDAEPFVFGGTPGVVVSDVVGDDLVFLDPANPSNPVVFHDSDGINGIDFPEQCTALPNGNLLVGGFSSPSGIYEYDNTGAQVNFVDTGALASLTGLRGVYPLNNGNVLFTNGTGVHVYDPSTNAVTTSHSGVSSRFIAPLGDGGIGTNYCAANPNSSGVAAVMSATGSTSVGMNDFHLVCSQMPQSSNGYFLNSMSRGFVVNPGGSQGNLCLGNPVGRFAQQVQNSGTAGEITIQADLTSLPTPTGAVVVMAGETWNFSCWFRDSDGMGNATSNFADGLEVDFQ